MRTVLRTPWPVAQEMLEYIATRDHRLMRRVNRWSAPRWVRLWMLCATRGGDGWLWYALGLLVFLFGGGDGLRALAAMAVATGAGIVLFLWLKRLTGRRRPCQVAPHCWATLLPPDQFSFPSGHTITAFAVAIPAGLFLPGLMPGVVFCAFSVAVSRVMLGMHFLSDVVAGAILGGALGYASYCVFA
jgi:undecaprenyl-diphosphatase